MQSANDYEDLLALWSDLESGLGIVLGNPANTQEFAHRVIQYDRWMQSLLRRDPDVGLYLLFQLAGNSPVGYSASHALVCAVLCHFVAAELALSPANRDSLVRAALTMNIAMTALQDELAVQSEKPTAAQQDLIRVHAAKAALMLSNLGVIDPVWLDTVGQHHDDKVDKVDLRQAEPAAALARILNVVDRYAAMISPRVSRAGRSATESARSILPKSDEVGHALVRAVGSCPPGTFVRLDTDALGVVVRRGVQAKFPWVVLISKATGESLAPPVLHSTEKGSPIRSALAASTVRTRLNHFQILQLGADPASGV